MFSKIILLLEQEGRIHEKETKCANCQLKASEQIIVRESQKNYTIMFLIFHSKVVINFCDVMSEVTFNRRLVGCLVQNLLENIF